MPKKNYSLAVYDYQGTKLCDLANENIFIKGEAYNVVLHKEINGYKELNFNIPAKIEDENGNIIDNFRVDFLKNEYKVKLKVDNEVHDFIIKNVQRQRDSSGVVSYSVKCVCAAFDKLSKSGLDLYFEDEVGNAQTLLTKVLEGSDWSVGVVDTFIQDDGHEKYRTLSGEKTNRYSLIQEICNLFECYPVFHTDTKKVDLRSEIGVDRGVQFRYSKNLKEITQNIDSDETITKLWVEGGEHPDHGLTLISSHNPIGENYILNFQYYIDLGLLTSEQIAAINQFQSDITNINNAINTLLNDIASLSLDKTLKESEKEGKEIEKIAKQQAIEELNKKIAIEKNATIKQQLINQRDALQAQVNTLTTDINNLTNAISDLDSQITTKESKLSTQLNNKNTAIKNLEQAVGDFIREGIYQNTNYIDAEALYKDALKVSGRLAYPRVSYEVNVLDLSRLTGYEVEKFRLGDIVYIIDETLNINTNGRITTIDYVLDNPKDTRITISNYDTKFEDLFKKIITATNIINSHKEIYDRVKGINADGTLNYDLLQKTFDNNTFQVKFGTNNNVITDKYGITIKDNNDPNKIVRINAGGIFITSDGGQTWKYALSADGISALNIVSGLIDTKVLQIWNSDQPRFHWDATGLIAVDAVDPNKWIKFNENGIFYTQDGGRTYVTALTFDGINASAITTGTLIADRIAAGTITAEKIAANSIHTSHIQDAAVTSPKIQDGAITSLKIANAAIDTAHIKDGIITGAKIGQAVIDATHIKDAAIQEAKIADLAVTTAKIQDAAITSTKIGQAAIDTAHIKDLAVTDAKIANAAITTAKIADAAITTAKIANAAIDNAKIADAAIDTAKIQDGAITNAKIAVGAIDSAKISHAAIDTAHIKTGAITTALIAQGAVGTAQIADGSITDAKIVSLNANKINAGTINTGQVTIQGANGKLKISNNRLQVFDNQPTPVERVSIGDVNNDGTVYGIRVRGADGQTVLYDHNGVYTEGITNGAITNPKIADDAVDSRVIAANSILAEHIVAGAITGDKIAARTITANNIATNTITAASGVIADAAITTTKIADGAITNAKIANAAVNTAKIADASITDAKIVDLKADKIKSGTINSAIIKVGDLEQIELNGYSNSIVVKDAVLPRVVIGRYNYDSIQIATFTRSSVAYLTDGTQVAANQPRFEQGRFGKAIMVEEGTTNLIQNPSFENDLTSWGNWGSPTTREVVSNIDWHGSKALHLVTNANNQGVYQSLSLTAGATYTVSCWVYVVTGRPVLMVERYNDGQVSYPVVRADSSWAGDGKWHRLQLTFTAGNTSNRIYLGKSAAGDIGEYYFDAVQLEAKPYATSFIDGTRSPETLTIPTAGVLNPQEGTVEFVVIPQTPHVNPGGDPWWNDFTWGAPGTDGFLIRRGVDTGPVNRFQVEIYGTAVGKVQLNYDATFQQGTPYTIAFRWSASGCAFFVDGVKRAETTYLFAAPTTTQAQIGYRPSYRQADALIDDLRISSRARSDEEIAAAYASGQPLPVDEWTTLKMSFDGNLYTAAFDWGIKITNGLLITPKVVIDENNYIDETGIHVPAANIVGKITASQLQVNSLSAISANLGTVTVGGYSNQNGLIRVLNSSGAEVVRLNNEGITLSNGAKLIGDSGVLSVLTFQSDWQKAGWWEYGGMVVNHRAHIWAFIPANFMIVSATLVTKVMSRYLTGWQPLTGTPNGYYTIKSAKIYHVKGSAQKGYYDWPAESEPTGPIAMGMTDITTALWGGTWSPPAGTTIQMRSNNVKSYLSPGERVVFAVDSGTTTDSWTGKNAAAVQFELTVIGYKQ